jgi:hypothetical protein
MFSRTMANPLAASIAALAAPDASARAAAAAELYQAGRALSEPVVRRWRSDAELARLLGGATPQITVGIAVMPETFSRICAANCSPRQAEVPAEQDAREFELHFDGGISLDILTTRDPAGSGAVARYLAKLGEGIQQVEYRAADVERATRIVKERYSVPPVYPETRPGANGTRINFFLAPTIENGRVLIELYEAPKKT